MLNSRKNALKFVKIREKLCAKQAICGDFAAIFRSKMASESQKWTHLLVRAKNKRHSDYFLGGYT